MAFFTETEQIIKFVWNHKRPWIAKAILRIKNKAKGIHLPDFRLCHKAIVMKTGWYGVENRHRHQQNRIESMKINPPMRGQLSYNTGAKNIQKKTASSVNGAEKTGTATYKRMRQYHHLTSCTNINSKWIEDLNIRPATILN